MSAIQKEVDEARATHLDEADLRQALGDFGALWNTMTLDQRRRTLTAVIERISYDGTAETVAITFRPLGIKALAGEPR